MLKVDMAAAGLYKAHEMERKGNLILDRVTAGNPVLGAHHASTVRQ